MKELTHQQKIDAIKTDILDRDQDNYVKIRRSGRLGWESLIPKGGSYSDLLRTVTTVDGLVKESYAMARDYIVAMDTPYKVTLRLSPQTSCTDSKVVYLATKVFDDADLTDGQKVDTFVGLAVHEGCHLKWTDFIQMQNAESAMERNLINILEDERIERLCGEQMPGYANFLKMTKYYMFGLYRERQAKNPPSGRLSDGARLFNAILSIVRYPKALDESDAQEFADYLYDVRELLREFPKTSEEVSAAAKAIYEIIRKFFEDQSSKDDGKGEDEDNTGSENSKDDEMDKSGDGTCGGENDSQESEDSGSVEGNNSDREKSEQMMKDLEDVLGRQIGELTTDPSSGLEPLSDEMMAGCVKRNSSQLAGICENSVSLGQTPHSVLYRAEEMPQVYDESLRRVRKYVPAISKALKGYCSEYQVTYHGMRSGVLDTGKLAEAFQGVQNVYVREGKVKSDKMAVCVLIDESGSMYGEKINAARDLSVLLNEAISSVPAIDLYIYGHTYGDRCRDSYRNGEQIAELQVYREKGYSPRKALGSVESRSGNLDSFAIREAAARMKKFSSAGTNLMFVITDGAPNERYENLTNTVRMLEKQGMNIVAVCIEPNYDPSQLYSHYVRFTDMSTLAIDLGRMIKKAILNNANRHNE